jgi:hypothetical protein
MTPSGLHLAVQERPGAVKATVHALTRAGNNQPLAALLGHLNQVLRGWTAYFRHEVSKRTFDYRELGKHCPAAQ